MGSDVPEQITGVILAGGRGVRMSADGRGVDKGLVLFRNAPLVAHVIERLHPQVSALMLNAASDHPRWIAFGLPVIVDHHADRVGPLGGIYAALVEAKTEWVVCAPCDTPFLPRNLVKVLADAQKRSGADVVSVRTTTRSHPTLALIRGRLRSDLDAYLRSGERKLERWYDAHRHCRADFDNERSFVNLNTPEELQALENES